MADVVPEVPANPPERGHRAIKWIKAIYLIVFGILLAALHYFLVKSLFENNRNFAYLSDLEREMSLRTEMGFYYSYYKTLVEEEPFVHGLNKILYDKTIEYPKEINAFNRFNIHPEVILGFAFRYVWPWVNASRECHQVHRGENIPTVTSCVGLADQMYFYLEAVWWLAGLTLSALFWFATSLSGTVLGGMLASVLYLANHAESTRVMWTPNERENFAQPFLILQIWLVTLQLKNPNKRSTLLIQVALFFVNAICLLFWQFSQFVFTTQIAILFVMEQFHIIDIKSLGIHLHSQFCGLHLAIIMLHGNDMLKSSVYICFFFAISIYSMFFSSFRMKVKNKTDLLIEFLFIVIRILSAISFTMLARKFLCALFETQDDSHIFAILYSKFSNYKNFHSMLYTCSKVFDYLPFEYFQNVTLTGLFPAVLLVVFNLVYKWIWDALKRTDNAEPVAVDVKDEDVVVFLKNLNIDPATFYNVSQMFVFGFMAFLVMRLKLLLTPQMCIVAAIAMSEKYYCQYFKKHTNFILLALLPLYVLCVYRGVMNFVDEYSNIGEFSDIPMENLVNWILEETSPTAVFAGPMPLMAAVILTTRRPIVNHPHYEHWESRLRNYAVYKTYGKFSPAELYNELSILKANYLIIERNYCYGKSENGCSFEEIWDIEVPSLKDRPRLCHKLLTEDVNHFYKVYKSKEYAVFKIHDISVTYAPLLQDS